MDFKEQALSSDGEMRSRLQERVEEADLTLTLQKTAGKTPKWAEANIERAEALLALAAEEEGGEAFACYEQAIVAYEQALDVYNQETYLSEWGGTIVALVRALRIYAAREGGQIGLLRLCRCEKLLDSVVAAMPEGKGQIDRAMLMIEQAHLHRIRFEIDRLSEREHHLRAAIACFEEAARILRLKENFDNWAAAIIGQALAWRELAAFDWVQSGEPASSQISKQAHDNTVSALLRSVALFKSAASYHSPDRDLNDFVFCHFEQGRSLLRLARVTQGEACHQAAQEAVASFKIALEHIREDYTPELWMRCHIEMASSLIKLEDFAPKDELVELVQEEIAIFRLARDHYGAREDIVTCCAMASNLGQKLLALADFKQGRQAHHVRMEALEALRQSAHDKLKIMAPDDWLSHNVDLGIALHNVAAYQEGKIRVELCEEAVEVYHRALQHMDEHNNANACALLRNRLGRLLSVLGEDDESKAGLRYLEEAHGCFCLALGYYDTTMQHLDMATPQGEREQKIILDLIRFKNNFATTSYILAGRTADAKAKKYIEEARVLLENVMPLVKTRCATPEWYEAYALYGRLVKQRLQRGFVENKVGECEAAATVLRQALKQLSEMDVASCDEEYVNERQQGLNNKLSCLILYRHLADIVYMWGGMLPKAAARPLFDEAHDLVMQLCAFAEECGLEDVVLSSREELGQIEAMQDRCRRGWIFRRCWFWLRSVKVRLA